jgi:hypothetical protein
MNPNEASLPLADDDLWSLVEGFVEGTGTQDDCQRLDDRLRAEPESRQFYVAYLDLHAQLQWRTRGEAGQSSPIAQTLAAPRPRTERQRLIWSSLAALGSLTAAVAIAFLLWLPQHNYEEAETPELPVKPAGAVAVLIDNSAPVWDTETSGPTKSGSYLLPGRLKLKSGVVEIAFDSGGEILLEGPADFDVGAADRGFLHSGKLTAKVSDQGASFFVSMPGAATSIEGECGLLLDAAGRAEVHVFSGEVRADPTDARGELLPGGRSIENGGAFIDPALHLVSMVPLNPGPFARLRPDVRVSDSAVRDGSHANENFGAAPHLVVKNSIPGYSWETFLRFDLSGVKGPIRDATVRLVPIKVGQPMENAAAVVPNSDFWSEQVITWDTKPPSGPAFANWTVVEPKPIQLDVTQQVREALMTDSRLALRIFAPIRKRGSAYVQYGSREGSPELRPQLIVTPAVEMQTRLSWQTDEIKNTVQARDYFSYPDGLSWFAPRLQSDTELLVQGLKF